MKPENLGSVAENTGCVAFVKPLSSSSVTQFCLQDKGSHDYAAWVCPEEVHNEYEILRKTIMSCRDVICFSFYYLSELIPTVFIFICLYQMRVVLA